MTFPALMYKKKPYQQEWADIKSLFTLAKEIKYLTQKDSLIFTDISKDFTLYSKQKAFVNDQRLLNYNDPWVNYLTSSDRQFYFLSGYLLRFEDKNKYDRRNMVKFNNKVIYDLIDKELLKSRFKNENFYILIKSENIEKIDNSNKQLIYEDNKYSFFKLI